MDISHFNYAITLIIITPQFSSGRECDTVKQGWKNGLTNVGVHCLPAIPSAITEDHTFFTPSLDTSARTGNLELTTSFIEVIVNFVCQDLRYLSEYIAGRNHCHSPNLPHSYLLSPRLRTSVLASFGNKIYLESQDKY